MQIESEVTGGKAESGVRGHKNLEVVEVEFLPTLGAEGRLKQVYDLLLSPGQGDGQGEDTEG